MQAPVPPFDRAIALACTLHTLRGRWLHVACACRASSSRPICKLLAQDAAARGRSLADAVVLLRCDQCRARPCTVYLTENGLPPDVIGHVQPGWRVLLHPA